MRPFSELWLYILAVLEILTVRNFLQFDLAKCKMHVCHILVVNSVIFHYVNVHPAIGMCISNYKFV